MENFQIIKFLLLTHSPVLWGFLFIRLNPFFFFGLCTSHSKNLAWNFQANGEQICCLFSQHIKNNEVSSQFFLLLEWQSKKGSDERFLVVWSQLLSLLKRKLIEFLGEWIGKSFFKKSMEAVKGVFRGFEGYLKRLVFWVIGVFCGNNW